MPPAAPSSPVPSAAIPSPKMFLRARAMPWQMAPAWPEKPPPLTRIFTSTLAVISVSFKAAMTELRSFVSVKYDSSDRRSEEHTSELQSHSDLVCRLLLEKKKKRIRNSIEYKNMRIT